MKMKSMKSIMVKVLSAICFVMIKIVSMTLCAIGVFTMFCANEGIKDWKILLTGTGLIALGVSGSLITDKVYDK